MKLEICYILRGRRMTQMVWKPRIMVPNSKIMAKAIIQASRLACNKELLANAYPGEDIVASRAITLFHIATGGLRLSDEAAAELYQLVRKAMNEEGVLP